MSDQWFCLIDNKKYGPFQWSRLQELAASGRLRGEHLLQSGTGPWVPAGTMHGLFAVAPPPQPVPPQQLPPPQARPAVAQGVPVGGIPVGQAFVAPPPVPSMPTAAPPMGRPQGSIPQGIPAGVPVGIPTGSVRPPLGASIVPPPMPPSRSAEAPKPRDNSTLLFIGGGSVAAIAVVGGILAANGAFSSSPKKETVAATAPTALEPTTPTAVTPETPAAVSPEPSVPKAESKAIVAESAKSTSTSPEQTAADIAAISQWRDASKVSGITIGKVQFALKDVWLAANASGTPLSGDAAEAGEESEKFLCVSLKIANAAGAAPVNYGGWNDSDHGAKLVAADGSLVSPLPVENVTTLQRLGAKKIGAGETQFDTIVFKLPSDADLTKFRVAFPKKTLLAGQAGYFAYEIPDRVLGAPANIAAGNDVPAPSAQAIAAEEAPRPKVNMKKPAGDGPIPIPGLGEGGGDDSEMDPKEAEIKAKMEKLRQEREKMKGKDPAAAMEKEKSSDPEMKPEAGEK